MTTLQQTIAAMKAREQKATPGPWMPSDDIHDIENDNQMIVGNYDYEEGGFVKVEDRDFTVAARTLVPLLIAIVEHQDETLRVSQTIHASKRGHYLKQRSEELEEMVKKVNL